MVKCAVCNHVYELRNHWDLKIVVCSTCRLRNPSVSFCEQQDERGQSYHPTRLNERVEQ